MNIRLLALCFVALSACNSTPAAGTDSGPTTADSGATVITVTLADFTITPSRMTVPAGSIRFDVTNNGTHVHEMVIAHTDLAANMLPTMADGTVDEDMLDSPGEVSETEAGGTGTLTVTLAAGHYVFFCNVGDHYSRGMYTTLTVTP